MLIRTRALKDFFSLRETLEKGSILFEFKEGENG